MITKMLGSSWRVICRNKNTGQYIHAAAERITPFCFTCVYIYPLPAKISDLVIRCEEPVLLDRTRVRSKATRIGILGSNQGYSADQARQAMAVARLFREGCTATTTTVQFGNNKCLDDDQISVRPVETKTQVSIFMQQQSGSHHSVSPEYVLSASDDSGSRHPLDSLWRACSELVLIERSRFWLQMLRSNQC